MDDLEFERITKDIPQNAKTNCKHSRVVKLYTLGTQSDYGCLDCGLQHTNKEAFCSTRKLGFSNCKTIKKEAFCKKATCNNISMSDNAEYTPKMSDYKECKISTGGNRKMSLSDVRRNAESEGLKKFDNVYPKNKLG